MDQKKKYLIIYHREDNDGVFSGVIVYNYLTAKLKVSPDDITARGFDYNALNKFTKENSPKKLHEDFTDVIMTDISFNDPKTMKAMWKEFGSSLVWCDHHAPIIKASLPGGFSDIPGVRQTDRSAILCAWKFFYDPFDEDFRSGKNIPELLRILSAYDSWTFEKAGYAKQYATEVNVGVTSYFNLDFKKVCEYVSELIKNPDNAEPTLEELELKGRLLNDHDTKHINNVVENSGDLSWTLDNGKRKLCALFSQGIFGSKAFATLLGKVDNGVVFRRQPDGNWTLSLYNVSDGDTFDCGAYMKQNYGGGGHVGAAGGTITEDKFIEILKKKQL